MQQLCGEPSGGPKGCAIDVDDVSMMITCSAMPVVLEIGPARPASSSVEGALVPLNRVASDSSTQLPSVAALALGIAKNLAVAADQCTAVACRGHGSAAPKKARGRRSPRRSALSNLFRQRSQSNRQAVLVVKGSLR